MGLATLALAQTEPAAPVGPRIEARVGWDRTVLSEHASDTKVTYKDSAGKSGVTYGSDTAKLDADRHQVVAGFGYRF